MKTDLLNAENILIIRLSSLGDVLLTIPVIGLIKKKLPNSKLSFITNNNFVDAVKFNPFLQNVFAYDKVNPATAISELNKYNFDFVIDLQNNSRSKKIRKSLNAPFVSFKKPNFKKFVLVNFKADLFKRIKSIPEMYAESVELTEPPSFEDFNFYFEHGKADWKPVKNKVCLCPGSQHFTKRYPIEYFIRFGKYLKEKGFEVTLLGGKTDKSACETINGALNNAHVKCGKDDLFEIAKEMETCATVICNDSGLMHLASAVGTPVIAIFGSSVKQFGFAPFTDRSLLLENNSLSCRPCSHIGREKCPEKHFRCMREITPEFLLEQFLGFYERYV